MGVNSGEPKAPAAGSAGEANPTDKMNQLFGKSLGTVASLSKLLPTGTALAFQTMAPSFTKGGECIDHDVNFAFTWGLIVFLTLLCAVLSFTDRVADKNGNTYYGIATPRGFVLFNGDLKRSELPPETWRTKKELNRTMKMNWRDWLHAVVSAAVFLAVAFCDAGVQRCLVPTESQAWRDCLNHMPLAVGFLASFVLIIFPSKRKGIGVEDDVAPWWGRGGTPEDINKRRLRVFDKTLVTAAGLSKLLPTGTTLAFQTLAPSFAKGGECRYRGVNFAFTWGLIGFLTLLCAVLSFTDSIVDEHGNTYYGIATRKGLRLFDHHPEEGGVVWEEMKRSRRMRQRDWLHALLSAGVFLALAFCDAGVQGCLVPKESRQWREFLTLLPLAVGFVASFVFIIFPSTRKGIGEEGVRTAADEEVANKSKATKEEDGTTTVTTTITTTTTTKTSKSSVHAMGTTQGAPSSSSPS